MTRTSRQLAQQLLMRLNPRRRFQWSDESCVHRGLLEFVLIVVVFGIMALLHAAPTLKTIVLNLYFLPVSLSGFYLGRYRAGVMALLCVLSAGAVTCFHSSDSLAGMPLVFNLLALCVWGSVLGLTAVVIGTLSDNRAREIQRLSESNRTDTLSDALTGVANRRAFEYELKRRVAEWQRQRVPLSMVLADVDRFKKFNDTYGHQAGDAVLQEVARQLKNSLRETDLIARYGGEEFAIVMPHTSLEDAKQVAERSRLAIEECRFQCDALVLRLTVSFGVAQILLGEECRAFVERADSALYASKQAGRNCVHVHDGAHCGHFGAPLCAVSAPPHATDEGSWPSDAYADGTTGLPSRRVFVEELRRRLSEVRRYQSPLSLMLVQLADPAEINGEQSLREKSQAVVGEFIRNMMRDADLVCRFDEAQFAVLMPSTPATGAMLPAERLRAFMATCRSVKHHGAPLDFRISIGLASSRTNDDAAAILQRAQRALWMAVEAGGNRSYFNDGDSSELVVVSPDLLLPLPPLTPSAPA